MLSVNIKVSQTLMTEVGQNFLYNLILKSEEEMRWVFDDKDNFCQFFIKKTLFCWCLLRSPKRGDSNEPPKHMFFMKK